MKKLFSILIALILIGGVAMAESTDYASMTDEELHTIIDRARNELTRRELTITGETLVLDAEGVQVYVTGNMTYDGYRLKVEAIIINDTAVNLAIDTEQASVNGWTISNAPGMHGTAPRKKQKGYFDFYITPDLLPDVESVTDVEFVLKLKDQNDGYKTFYTSDPIALHFGTEK